MAGPATALGQTLSAVWDPNPAGDHVTRYEVCIGSTSSTCDFQQATVAPDETSFRFSAAEGTLYYVGVRAVNEAGLSSAPSSLVVSIPRLNQPATQFTAVNMPITPLALTAIDPDGSNLRFTHTGLPLGLTLNSATGVISGTPTVAGTFSVTVFVFDGLATISRSFVWNVTGGLTLTSSLPSPQMPNTAVTFTAAASGGTGSYQFKWWLYNGTAWTMVRDWGSASYTWTPTVENANYRIGIWARDAATTADVGTLNLSIPFVITGTATPSPSPSPSPSQPAGPLTITGLTPNVSSPRAVGTSITFTASATGGTGSYQYKWWVWDGTTWVLVRDWGSASYTWTPMIANANYRVGIWARDATTTADVGTFNLSIPFAITWAAPPPSTSPLTITALTSSMTSPQITGTSITFTASAAGGTGLYQFKWWLWDGTSWVMVRDWGSSSYTWTPTVANVNYRVGIWARDATTSADVSNVNMSVPYAIVSPTGSRLMILGITTNSPGSIRVGQSVTFTTSATGGQAPYQFKWWLYDGVTWRMVRDWGAATYTVTLGASGNYRVGVWARDSTTTKDVSDYNLSVPLTVWP